MFVVVLFFILAVNYGTEQVQLQTSVKQVAEHPSPEITFPSSHCSVLALTLSPQVEEQTLGVPEQANPVSITHTSEQPSPETELPSSQVSFPVFSPSPQITGTPVSHVKTKVGELVINQKCAAGGDCPEAGIDVIVKLQEPVGKHVETKDKTSTEC